MSTDAELLRRYLHERSEEAFAALVQRHLNLVYFAALRQVGGDVHGAKDIAQAVFTDLAHKAASLTDRATLTGWLHTSTRYAATKARRADFSRQHYEQEATTMDALLHETDPVAEWERLRPMIDDVIHELNETDREAVLLRFFEGRGFTEVGATLRVSEDAARMRVERALDKLRAALARRDVKSTGAALAMVLTNQVGATAPAGLAGAITSAALAGGAAAVGVAGAGIFMSTTKVILSTVAFAAIGAAFYQWSQVQRTKAELFALTSERDASRAQANVEKQRAIQEVAALRKELDTLKARPVAAPPSAQPASSAVEAARRKAIADGIQANLKQIAAARDQFHIENGRLPASVAELVGEGKPIKRLVVVGGENYADLSLAMNQSLVVATPDGVSASYDLRLHDSARTRIAAASEARSLAKKIVEPKMKALAAYRAANNGQPPLDDEALVPFFATPQEGADFLEFLAAQKIANRK